MSKIYPSKAGRVLGVIMVVVALFFLAYNSLEKVVPTNVYTFGAYYGIWLLLIWLGHAFFVGKIELGLPINLGTGGKGSGD